MPSRKDVIFDVLDFNIKWLFTFLQSHSSITATFNYTK
jgi:hypothetical protein